ncbi:MAG: chemotaxis protein CheB [Proteobacteria bacterium]|jgi:chemosensory pili system protein ChpB (putative protein-glutamate methylesterase)|nr:chemotaxis protein CheB [Pseudomonadota bacterium]
MMEAPRKSELNHVNLAIVSNSLRHRQHIQQVLERNGLKVVFSEPLSTVLLDKLHSGRADVLLLDMDEHMEKHGMFEQLLEESEVPIIFNDTSVLTINEPAVLAKWYGKLLVKISELTGRLDWEDLDVDLGWQTNPSEHGTISQAGQLAQEIWVLGASLGGPDALKQFLSTIPADLPVAFILAQHLGTNFMGLLADQLDRITPFRVMPAQVGHVLRHQEVLVVPVQERLQISPIGSVELHALQTESSYSPSIDTVLQDMAERYGSRCNTIIFSGMCNDGAAGARIIVQQGGEVWTQDENSCVISAMPDNIRALGYSSFDGTPRQLAHELNRRYAR